MHQPKVSDRELRQRQNGAAPHHPTRLVTAEETRRGGTWSPSLSGDVEQWSRAGHCRHGPEDGRPTPTERVEERSCRQTSQRREPVIGDTYRSVNNSAPRQGSGTYGGSRIVRNKGSVAPGSNNTVCGDTCVSLFTQGEDNPPAGDTKTGIGGQYTEN